MTAMMARQPTNFIPSCENLKSTGFGKRMERTSSPLDVEKPRQRDKRTKKCQNNTTLIRKPYATNT